MPHKGKNSVYFLHVSKNTVVSDRHVLTFMFYSKGLVLVGHRRNARVFTDPLHPCGPFLRSLQGPDVPLPNFFTLHRCEAAAKAVIGPLTKTRRRTKTCSRLRQRPTLTKLQQSGRFNTAVNE